jgi:hypothetical protein
LELEKATMRLLAAILALALAVFPASAGFAAPAAHTADCQHQSAMPAAGHDHHQGSTTVPAGTELACCSLHCVAVAGAFTGPVLPSSGLGKAIQPADEHSGGMDIEPAIPPPRG